MKDIKNEVIKLYVLSGFGSTTIIKYLPSTTKRQILKILNDNNLIRNRYKSKEFYTDFWFENNKWYGYWVCNNCNKKIQFYVSEKSAINKTLKNKKNCKACSLKQQIGYGNPFYGKSHSKQTKERISKKKIGIRTSNHASKPEYRELYRKLANERWANGSMETVRIKLSQLLKERISKGLMKGYNRSKAEDELITILTKNKIKVIPNYIIDSKIFDLYIPSINLLIEYNGDYWHCNPKKYKSDYFNKKKNKTAKELWEYDLEKLYLAKNNNYNYEVIWESDYKNNKNILINIVNNYKLNKK